MNKPRHHLGFWQQFRSFLIILLLAGAAAWPAAAQSSAWRVKMEPITPRGYLCRYTATPIVVDGKLDDAAWAAAPWTTDFVDIQGERKAKPRFRTRAKLLWDDDYLYIAAELEEPHVWATLTKHDSVIFQDPDFEVFIDPDGDTHSYYEFEMNALNTSWDLMLDKPYQDRGKANDAWDIPGLKTGVHVDGTLNDATDTDRGWTIEIAFPWKVLAEHASHAGPPAEGEQWRIDFSRVEWQITTNGGAYKKVADTPEDNWVWSPIGVVDMHRPEMWGLLQFTRKPAGEEVAVAGLAGKPARDLAIDVYYAQREFRRANERWATNLADLAWRREVPPGVDTPAVQLTPDGYVCEVGFSDAGKRRVWRIRQDRLLKLDQPMPVETEAFIRAAAEKFGDAGRRAAYFLVDNMPASDRGILSCDFLMENLTLALKARKEFPWAAALPERIFLNEVLPYASLDEPRDPWRADFYPIAARIVQGCKTTTEAAQALNREMFKEVNVHYNIHRRRNNQSPKESIEQHRATCTGLSIILVDACRAVGVPARVAGVPQWAQKDGNHTWVEIWDGDWYFTGADEYDKNGLNRGWFNGDAAQTVRSTNPLNQIYASSWRRTGVYFPLAWDSDSGEVPGVNVSARYAAPEGTTIAPSATKVYLRLRDKADGERLAATVELRASSDQLLATDQTRAGAADMNDMPAFTLPATGGNVAFRFVRDGQAREKVLSCAACMNTHTLDFAWDELVPVSPAVSQAEAWLARPAGERGAAPSVPFTRAETARVLSLAWEGVREASSNAAAAELSARQIVIGEKTLKWMERSFGEARDGKHSLWITMHGGGQGTTQQNDANWKGYWGRYEFPPGSINVAPRAPADTWNMWFIKEVDGLFDRLIDDMVLQRGVDPDRVYLIGYSAGGDGVYQLAPRMADRFAAAGMCAGHPNQVTPEGLRDLPFYLYMGGEDSAYHRNTVVREFSAKLDALQAADPAGYWHRLTVYAGLSHNMQGREAEMIPRMSAQPRQAWPKRVVWKQDDNAPHTRFYWLEVAPEAARPKDLYAAHVDGQVVTIEARGSGSLTLRLSDALLDLDRPVRVMAAGKVVFEGSVPRSFAAVVQSLRERQDPEAAATALLPVTW